MAENTTVEPGADTRRWCAHHIGADDVHPAPDFETAQRWADWSNEAFADHADISRWVVAIWPWSAASHSQGLAKSVADWTRPDGSPVQSERDRLAASAPDLLALLTRWADWLDRADEPDDDCSYLNDDGWDDARALAKLTKAALSRATATEGEG